METENHRRGIEETKRPRHHSFIDITARVLLSVLKNEVEPVIGAPVNRPWKISLSRCVTAVLLGGFGLTVRRIV